MVMVVISQTLMMMSLRITPPTSLVFLLLIHGVVAQNGWAVNYKDTSICALKGSEVTMSCTYTYPNGPTVKITFWTKQWGRGSESADLSDDPEYRGRVQYLGDKQHNCTLRLRDVSEKDQSKYYFRFITDRRGGKYQGAGGVDLSVTDLQVEVPERVIEGDNVTLTCKTSCSLSVRPTITWYRNGRPLSSSTDQLHLQPVSREDAGRYLCAVLGQNLLSPEVPLNVRYGPKNISVSISPSGEIVEGSSVNLTCSSDANPRVQNYTWFKGTSLVTKRETYTMKKISSVDSGEYKCKCSNEHGEKYSAALTLNVLYPPKSVSVSISPSGEIVEGSSVTLSCSSDANPPVEYNWFKGTSLVAKGETYTMEKISSVDSGEYKCRSSNEHGENLSEALTLNVLWHPNVFLYIIACTIVGSGGVFLTLAILFIRRKRKGHSAGEPKSIQENLYSNMGTRPSVNNPTDLANQDDGYYSTVELCGRINPTYGAEDEVQYGNIQHRRDKIVQMTQEAGVEYACVRFSRADPAHSSAALESPSVIYSSVN